MKIVDHAKIMSTADQGNAKTLVLLEGCGPK